MNPGRIFLYTLGFIILPFLFSCNTDLAGDISIKEIKRIPSPDHQVEAVLIEADAGATTSTSTKLFIVKPGKKISLDSLNLAVFNSDNFSGGDINWKENKKLVISYKAARIFNYRNFWEDDNNYNYKVDILVNRLP